jgi:PhnB protein
MMAVSPIPEGYYSVTPYLIFTGADKAIEFYKKVFGATEFMRFDSPDGKVAHAELEIGNSKIMVAEEYPDRGFKSPQTVGGSASGIMLYVADVDGVFGRAVQAGATVHQPIKDQFYGDRSGTLIDPFGHFWTVATHVEDVSVEEMQRRMKAQHG